MKKLIILTWLMIVSLIPAHVMAGNAADGTVLGAMGGAALGQAIGRDTEATVIGAALGSLFGYMIGSESERSLHMAGRVVTPVYPQRGYPVHERSRNIVVYDHYLASPPPTTVIVNKTVIRRAPVRHVVWQKRHQPRWENKNNRRHHYKQNNYTKLHRNDYDRDRFYRNERRERW